MNKLIFKQYLAGFVDGDGCVEISYSGGYYIPRIKISQSNKRVLDEIVKYYPELILTQLTGSVRGNTNHRYEWQLRSSGTKAKRIFQDIHEFAILKFNQIDKIIDFYKEWEKPKKDRDNKILENIKVEISNMKKERNNSEKPYERLNNVYIAGLFDAEGCILLKSLRLDISQKSNNEILKRINIYYNNEGKVQENRISFYKKEVIMSIITDIESYLIYKKPQTELCKTFIRTTDEITKSECIDKCKVEKNIDIDISESMTNINFTDKIQHAEYLKKCIHEMQKYSVKELMLMNKNQDLIKLKKIKKYEDQIYNLKDWTTFNVENLNIQLEFCENYSQRQLFYYYRNITSSLSQTGKFGRRFNILVKDTISNKYIGIMSLGSDLFGLGERDKYIGWNNEIKKKKLVNILNLTTCVPLQPFGYNCNGGKLLASLAFSKEIYDYYYAKYNTQLLGILTTSINGKSIQYDRLQNLKFIGMTKGYGSSHIPKEVQLEFTNYKLKWIQKNFDRGILETITEIAGNCGISKEFLNHGMKRGIYFGYTTPNAINYLKHEQILDVEIAPFQTVKQISHWWYSRWCEQRLKHLNTENRLQIKTQTYTVDNTIKKFKLPLLDKGKKNELDDDIIYEIMDTKLSSIKIKELSKKFTEKYKIDINVNCITNIYNGNKKPKCIPLNWQDKINKKKVTVSDEKIYKVLKMHEENIIKGEICKSTKLNYATVQKIIDKIMLPIIEKPIKKIVEKNSQQDKTTNEYINKINVMTCEQIMMVMRYKTQNLKTEDVAKEMKKENISIKRNFVSMVWKGEYFDNINEKLSDKEKIEYQELVNIQVKQRKGIVKTQESIDKFSKTIKEKNQSKIPDIVLNDIKKLREEQKTYLRISEIILQNHNFKINRNAIAKLI